MSLRWSQSSIDQSLTVGFVVRWLKSLWCDVAGDWTHILPVTKWTRYALKHCAGVHHITVCNHKHLMSVLSAIFPAGIWRLYNVVSTSSQRRCIDVEATLYSCHVSAGFVLNNNSVTSRSKSGRVTHWSTAPGCTTSLCVIINIWCLCYQPSSQRAYDVYTTSSQRRCNVMTLHRRWGDVV